MVKIRIPSCSMRIFQVHLGHLSHLGQLCSRMGSRKKLMEVALNQRWKDSPKSQQPGLEPLEPVNEGATVPAAERDVERQEVDSRQLDNELLETPADPSAAAQKIQEAKDEAPEDEFPANGTDVDVGTPHVVLHSPMIAVRREPCTRSVVLRYMRPGEKIALAEWDATHQWRRAFGEDAWVPVRHPTLGTLARPEGSGKDSNERDPRQGRRHERIGPRGLETAL